MTGRKKRRTKEEREEKIIIERRSSRLERKREEGKSMTGRETKDFPAGQEEKRGERTSA